MTTTTTTQTAPVKPADLSLYVLHTPAARRQHQQAMYDYHAACRAIEQAEQAEKQAAVAEASRLLTEGEYWTLALERERENKAKIKAAHDAEVAAQRAETERLMSSPDVVDVLHRNEHNFVRELCHWANRGYRFHDDSMQMFMPGSYHATLLAPAAPAAKGSKA